VARKPVGALADALAIHPSTATRLCDRLVSKRLVRRAVSRENRRETTISLSPTGRDLVDEVTNIRHDEIAAIVARVPVQGPEQRWSAGADRVRRGRRRAAAQHLDVWAGSEAPTLVARAPPAGAARAREPLATGGSPWPP